MTTQSTPFHSQDQVRNAKFLALYHWAKGLQMNPTKAFHIAKKKTLALYPINPGETFYAHKEPTLPTQV